MDMQIEIETGEREGADVSEGNTMSTHENADPILDDRDLDLLAEVIELPVSDAPSFYQRNSGALPKAEAGMSDAHRRTQLPTPQNSDVTTIKDRLLGLFNR